MGWYAGAKREMKELHALSYDERRALTWKQVEDFIEPDTLELAAWLGCKDWANENGKTPYEALMRLKETRGD